MNFRTEFLIPQSKHKIALGNQVVTLGSCFSEVVGSHLKANKLQVSANALGTMFNPLSIFKVLTLALTKQQPDQRLYLQEDELWFHYDFHSSMVGTSQEDLAQKLAVALNTLRENLQTADFLIITFGTAFVHQLNSLPVFVANCHKQPSHLFAKDLLSVKDVCKAFGALHRLMAQTQLKAKIVLTVSPVRHTREGIPQNQVSKSILRAACHYLVTDYQDIEYFPSYEIMVDDLRDYRFYEADLIHPSKLAESYIFDKFSATYFDEQFKDFVEDWQGISKALAHRPFNPQTEAHQKFLKKILSELERLSQKVELSTEIEDLKTRII